MAHVYFSVNTLAWIGLGILVILSTVLLIPAFFPLRKALPSALAAFGFVVYFFSGSQTSLIIWIVSGILSLVFTVQSSHALTTRLFTRWMQGVALLATLMIALGFATSPLLSSPFSGTTLTGFMDSYLAADQRVFKISLLTSDKLHFTVLIRLKADEGAIDNDSMRLLLMSAENVSRLIKEARAYLAQCSQLVSENNYVGAQLDVVATMRLAYVDYLGNFSLFALAYGQAFTFRESSIKIDLDYSRSSIIQSFDLIEKIVSKGLIRFAPALWNYQEEKTNALKLVDDMYAEASLFLASAGATAAVVGHSLTTQSLIVWECRIASAGGEFRASFV
jgi:hypothetical protein